MSTWTSKALATAALLGLAACQPGGLPGAGGAAASRAIKVLGGSVTVTAARGYCADPKLVREASDSAVAFIGRCADIAGVDPAVLTVSLGAPGSGGVMAAGGAAVAAFFGTPAGRAMLSPRGRASDVRLLSGIGVGDMVLLQVQDRGAAPQWRAMTAVSGRLASIAMIGGEVPAEQGKALVRDTALALQRANRPG